MKPGSAKGKGRRFQQKIAKSILDTFPHLKEDDAVSTSMGAGGEDVRLSTEARKAIPVSIECKCVEKLNVWSCLEQASRNTPDGATPCLVFSRNRSLTYAVLPWETVLSLYKTSYYHASDGEGVSARLGDVLLQLGTFVDAEREKRRRKEDDKMGEKKDEEDEEDEEDEKE